MRFLIALLRRLETRAIPLQLPKRTELTAVQLRPLLKPIALDDVELVHVGLPLRMAIRRSRTDTRRRETK